MFHMDHPPKPVLHLGCQCRPWIMSCGVFIPKAKEYRFAGPTVSDVLSDTEIVTEQQAVQCEDCYQTWPVVGCGICKCVGDKVCGTCSAGKHAAI